MRTQILPGWVWGMVLAGGVVVAGWGQEEPDANKATVSPAKTSAAVSTPATPAEPGSPADESFPVKTQLSPRSLEVEELAQAQVEEGVMLAYVTNCLGVFSLGADDIIYLKNAGVSQGVIQAMIEHDRASLTEARPVMLAAAPSVAAAAACPDTGAAPMTVPEEGWAGESLAMEEPYYVAEQPEGAGPVRAPYPVKLNDPIVILKLPTITVPYW
jgi:hypothetical protein